MHILNPCSNNCICPYRIGCKSGGGAFGDEFQKAFHSLVLQDHLIVEESNHEDLPKVALLHSHHHPKTQDEAKYPP